MWITTVNWYWKGNEYRKKLTLWLLNPRLPWVLSSFNYHATLAIISYLKFYSRKYTTNYLTTLNRISNTFNQGQKGNIKSALVPVATEDILGKFDEVFQAIELIVAHEGVHNVRHSPGANSEFITKYWPQTN